MRDNKEGESMVKTPSLRELLEAGVHFGHKTSRWDPRMDKFIFTAKNKVHVINLEKTVEQLEAAMKFVSSAGQAGKNIVFVGTKKQAQEIVKKAAEDCGCSYVADRWLGGLITNFFVVQKSVKKLERMKLTQTSPDFEMMRKRDKVRLAKSIEKSERLVGGLLGMNSKPDVLILIGAHDEKNAVKEANTLNIPIVALVDTNTNPEEIDYPIPANDDATKSISLFANLFAKVIKEAKASKAISSK